MWKKVLREYFAFPKKERRGLAVLFLLWFLILFYSSYKKHFFEEIMHVSNYKLIVSEQLKYEDAKRLESSNYSTSFQKKIYPRYFNYVTEEELLHYGLSSETARNIIIARDTGLKIYTKTDLQKLVIDTFSKNILLEKLKFYPEKKYYNPTYISNNSAVKIDLNLADTNAIDQLRGLSKSMAKRICNYRDRLGGYISTEQLKEVWGMDSATYTSICNSVFLKSEIKKLNINTADIKTLGAHPYIGYNLGKLIVNYREQHGNYSKIKDLYQIHVMNEDIFSKIEVYITTSND